MDRQDHMASAEAERHPGKGADGSPWVTSVLVPASAKLDDPSVERLQRPVVVRVAAVAGEPLDHSWKRVTAAFGNLDESEAKALIPPD